MHCENAHDKKEHRFDPNLQYMQSSFWARKIEYLWMYVLYDLASNCTVANLQKRVRDEEKDNFLWILGVAQ